MGLTYAVGDIHGRHGLLVRMLARIHEHAAGRPHVIVFLGDYVDRGPASASVLATLRDIERHAPERTICLMGNHEWLLVAAHQNPLHEDWWRDNGGGATLASFGASHARQLPGDVVAWCGALPRHHVDARRLYVHAGLRPHAPLSLQCEEDLLWIREPFLGASGRFEKYVVHGHTPTRNGAPDIRSNRVNLDTGAGMGGPLTAAVFDDAQDPPRAILQVPGER